MDGFIFLPVESRDVKNNSSLYPEKVEKGEEKESSNFEQFLIPSLFSLGWGETAPVKDCSFSSTPAVSSCSPCSSSVVETATPGACAFSNCCNSSFEEILGVEGWKKTIDSFLSEVENISFTLNLGEKGKVLVSGGTGENGEFTFQISGDKEALSELLGRLIDYLVTFLEEKVFSYPLENSSLSECSLGQGGCSTGGGYSILPGNEVESEPEHLIIDDLPLAGEGEEITPGDAGFVIPGNEVEGESVVSEEGEEIIPLEVETAEEITPEFSSGLEEDTIEEVALREGLVFTSEEESLSGEETGTVKGLPPLETEKAKNTAQEKKVELASDFYGGAPGGRETSPVEETIDFSQVEKSEIPKIFDRVLQMVSQNEGEKEVVIQLKPESLGSIVIQVREDNNRVECVWQISDPRTQEIVVKNLPVLEAQLNEQGLWMNNYLNQNGHYFSHSGRPNYFSSSFSSEEGDAVTFSLLDDSSGKVNVLV